LNYAFLYMLTLVFPYSLRHPELGGCRPRYHHCRHI
jgi:hypothetical protein